MTRLTKSPTTFECEVELNGRRYKLVAELDIITRSGSTPFDHFGTRGARPEVEHDIEVCDWTAFDAGEHEVIDPELKRELRAELAVRLLFQRERILNTL